MGFWVRFVAYLIDGVLLGIITSIIVANMFGDPFYSSYTANAVSYAVDGVYFTITVSVWATTIGKRIFNMRVVRTDGSKVGPGRALARYLLYILSVLIFFIGFMMIGFRADKRGLHDLICDTQVVRRL